MRPRMVFFAVVCLAHLVASAHAESPTGGVYCLKGSILSVKRNPDTSIDLSINTSTSSGNSIYWARGHARAISPDHWVLAPRADLPDDRCVLDVRFNAELWILSAINDAQCGQHRGAHGPYEFPPFRAEDYVRPVTKPDLDQEDCDQAHAHAPRPLPVPDPKTPLEIIRQLYDDLVSGNGRDGVNSEKNHAKYFTLPLLAVFAAAMQDACAAAIELSGQDFDAAEVSSSRRFPTTAAARSFRSACEARREPLLTSEGSSLSESASSGR
jgi:hypothetical protein